MRNNSMNDTFLFCLEITKNNIKEFKYFDSIAEAEKYCKMYVVRQSRKGTANSKTK